MSTKSFKISDDHMVVWKKTEPRIDDEGIWMPQNEFVPEGLETNYRLIITKEVFVEAYNKWIREKKDE